jgi:hypothetical protein
MNIKLRDECVTPFLQCIYVTSCAGSPSSLTKSGSSPFSSPRIYQTLLRTLPSPPLLLLLLLLRSSLKSSAWRTSRCVLLLLLLKLLLLLPTKPALKWSVSAPPYLLTCLFAAATTDLLCTYSIIHQAKLLQQLR